MTAEIALFMIIFTAPVAWFVGLGLWYEFTEWRERKRKEQQDLDEHRTRRHI